MDDGLDVQELVATMARMQASLDAALGRIAELEEQVAGPVVERAPVLAAASPPDHAPAPAPPARVDRRRALRAGLVAAGAAATGAVLLDASPAAATDGSALLLGTTAQAATNPTQIVVSGATGAYGVEIVDNAIAGSAPGLRKPQLLTHARNMAFDSALYVSGESSADGIVIDVATGRGITAKSTGGVETGAFSNTGAGSALSAVTAAPTAPAIFVSGPYQGVRAITSSGYGVQGEATTGWGVRGVATTGNAVEGSATGTNGVAVNATATTGTAVKAFGQTGVASTSPSGFAVSASSTSGTGVHAVTTSGTAAMVGQAVNAGFGVQASSGTGIALSANSTSGGGAILTGGAYNVRLTTNAKANPLNDTISHLVGELFMGSGGDLWLCTTSGTGTAAHWKKLGGVTTAGQFHFLAAPKRVYDSRSGTSPSQGPKTPFAAGTTRVIDTTVNSSGVPAGATGVALTVLLVNAATANANFTIWANGQAKPSSNSMIWGGSAGRFSATVLSAVDATGKVKVNSSAVTNVVLDVVGYYR